MSRLYEKRGCELKQTIFTLENQHFWSRWLLRPVGHKTSVKPGPGQISGNLGTWHGNPECWGPTRPKKIKLSKSKSVSPKMSARSGLAGKKTFRPHLGPSQAIFSMDQKKPKNQKNCLLSLMGQWAALAASHPWLGCFRAGFKKV